MKRTNKTIKALIIGDGSEMSNLINYTSKKGLKYCYKNIIDDFDIFFVLGKKILIIIYLHLISLRLHH